VFYNTIYLKATVSTSKKVKSEVSCRVFCSDITMFVAQCFCCVLLAIRCALGAHLDVDASEQPITHGFIDVPVCFLSKRGERRAFLITVFEDAIAITKRVFVTLPVCTCALFNIIQVSFHITQVFFHTNTTIESLMITSYLRQTASVCDVICTCGPPCTNHYLLPG